MRIILKKISQFIPNNHEFAKALDAIEAISKLVMRSKLSNLLAFLVQSPKSKAGKRLKYLIYPPFLTLCILASLHVAV